LVGFGAGFDKSGEVIYNMFAVSKQITKAFRVEPGVWDNFAKAAANYGATPAELLRELIKHVDAAVTGIESGRLRSFNGDVARLLSAEFPQLAEFQLRMR
jgi:hypothetical protein